MALAGLIGNPLIKGATVVATTLPTESEASEESEAPLPEEIPNNQEVESSTESETEQSEKVRDSSAPVEDSPPPSSSAPKSEESAPTPEIPSESATEPEAKITGTVWGGVNVDFNNTTGVLRIIGGTITNPSDFDNMTRPNVRKIVFEGEVSVGGSRSLRQLFIHFQNLETIENLEKLNTSGVTNMLGMFWGASSLTHLDLSSFDTSSVINMEAMFNNMISLTSLDLTTFDTSSVTDMSAMFARTISLSSLDLSSFDTSSVTAMWDMFSWASSLSSLDLSNFDIASDTNIAGMFLNTSSLRELRLGTGISRLNGSGLPAISTTSGEFTGFWQNVGTGTVDRPNGTTILSSADLIQNFNPSMADTFVWQRTVPKLWGDVEYDWDGSTLTFLGGAITDPSAFPINRGSIEHIKFEGPVTVGGSGSLHGLFQDMSRLTAIENLPYLNTSAVTDMSGMFAGASSLTNLDLSTFDTTAVTDMSRMFVDADALTNLILSNFDTSAVTRMDSMFRNASSLTSLDLTSFDTSSVTDMHSMFNEASSLTSLDLSSFDTSNVISMSNMFFNASSLRSLDLTSFNIASTTIRFGMFWGATSLRELKLGSDISRLNDTFLPAISTTSGAFTGFWQNVGTGTTDRPNGATVLSSADLMQNFNPSMADTFVWQKALPKVWGNVAYVYDEITKTLTLEGGTITSPSDFDSTLRSEVEHIVFEGDVNVGGSMSLSGLFISFSNLVDIQNLEKLNTSGVTDMTWMFSGTRSLTSLDLSSFDTSSVTDMAAMLGGTESLTSLNLSSFDTSLVTDMSGMFGMTGLKSLDLSSFDTSLVTGMSGMFAGASNLTSLELTSFDTSSVTDLSWMFTDASRLTSLDLSSFDTDSVTSMHGMFSGANSLTSLDLSSFDIASATNINSMFLNTSSLRELKLGAGISRLNSSGLPNISTTSGEFTGFWRNVGTGTVDRPNGTNILSSADLMQNFNPSMADTFVWQKTLPRLWGDVEYDYDETTKTLTLEGGTITNSADFDATLRSEVEHIVFRGNVNVGGAMSLQAHFSGFENLLTIQNLEKLNTSGVTDMSWMFAGSGSLVDLDLTSFDTSSVTDMAAMFGITGLKSLDLSSFNTSSVTNLSEMFFGSSNLTSLDLSSFDTSSVTNMQAMFTHASSLTSLDLSSFDTSSVQANSRFNFRGLDALVELRLGNNTAIDARELPALTTTAGYLHWWAREGEANNWLDSHQLMSLSATPGQAAGTWRRVPYQTKVQVKDSTLSVGDTWQAKDNFIQAINREGDEVPFEDVTVTGIVDTTKAGIYEVTYAYDGVSATAKVTVKAEEENGNGNGNGNNNSGENENGQDKDDSTSNNENSEDKASDSDDTREDEKQSQQEEQDLKAASRDKLPETGEIAGMLSWLGLGSLAVAMLLWYKRRRKK